MNLTRLILRNLWFYRKACFAVLAGVMISTAVITGALIVGDSVRYSLHRLTVLRLGKIKYALQPRERFFRQELSNEISALAHIQAAPAVQATGIAINNEKNLRINQVQVTGIDWRFCSLWDQPLRAPGRDEAFISSNVAEKLGLKPGDDLLLRIQKLGKTPSNTPFTAEKEPSVSLHLKIAGIAGDLRMGRFSLKSDQNAPFNIFISLSQMVSELEMGGYANMIVAGGGNDSGELLPKLDSVLGVSWQSEDAGLRFRDPSRVADPARVEITSDRIFFNENTANAIRATIPGSESILTYLVNSVSAGSRSTPYSFVTAAGENFLGQALGNREILVSKWLADDLGIGPGDPVWLRYFIMGPMRSLREDSARFVVKAVLPENNTLADPGLMPAFPGMSDAGNCRDWETGAPVDLKKIRDKDELYWKNHRGTPKAFISLEAGQKIWDNRFGHYTAFRFMTKESQLPGIKKRLMEKLRPGQYGLTFRDVEMEGQTAAANSTDFGGLFLSLSFFIVAGAVLLTILLFSLMARSRMAETAILSATGFSRRKILGIMVAEAIVIALAGAIPGIFAGILYNRLLILGLNTLWNDTVNTSMIVMHVRSHTIITGAAAGILLSVAVMIIVLRQNLRNPLADLVRGASRIPYPASRIPHPASRIMIPASFILTALILLSWLILTGQTMNVTLFLAAGGLFLLGGLVMVNLFLKRILLKRTGNIPRFSSLVLKNVSLHRNRTLAVITLLSLGTFSVIITGANRKTFYGAETSRSSGTGGFLLWAETALPVMNDLNTPAGAKAYGLQDEDILKPVHFIQMTRLDGDDASCLNLNHVSQPVLLGVPPRYFDRVRAFTFTGLLPPADKEHPWRTLEKKLAPGVIPGFADQTVIDWGLGKKPGDTLLYQDESGKTLKVVLTGALDNSIFQGNILISDSLFRLFFPSSGGSKIMLADGPANKRDSIVSRLESLFRDQGMMITSTPARLAAFNAVENTYLSVFMLLGGLGVVIGTFGLGVVILRNIRQRKQEFAICMAVGFSKKFLLRMIVAEHAFMLGTGLFIGIISALAGILPSLISPGYTLPARFLTAIILVIFINGLLWIWLPARRVLTHDILEGLRSE